ncbi:MAG: hypothetical protein ACREOO_26535 [bacterium]
MSRSLKIVTLTSVAIYGILLMPSRDPHLPKAGERKAFAWRQDDYWSGLEARFRAALEEAMLQTPAEGLPALAWREHEPSQTPATKILGVTIHSGDILVSRGGAPTSALIARGNDYPGNFSHIALVHVDEQTSLASIIEAHIERGVAMATLEEYLRDKKLRVMVLRLRLDFQLLIAFLLATGARSPLRVPSRKLFQKCDEQTCPSGLLRRLFAARPPAEQSVARKRETRRAGP